MLISGRVPRSFTHLWASSCGFRPFDPGIIIKEKNKHSKKITVLVFFCEQNDKPGYVVNDHLSRPCVAAWLKQPTWNWRAAICLCSVLLRMGFTCAPAVTSRAVVSYTALPPLPAYGRRYISVALSLESPPPDVIRHPALWSPDFPRLTPFVLPAAIIYPTRKHKNILTFLTLTVNFHFAIIAHCIMMRLW